MRPIHIRAEPGEIADIVVAVGDPERAEFLSRMLEDARLVNRKRGLLTYTGYWRSRRATIVTHGMGGPSAAIVFEELSMLGAKTIIRLGSAGSVSAAARIGDVVVAPSASVCCGASTCGLSLYYDRIIPPLSADPLLTLRIAESLRKSSLRVVLAPVFCSDSFYAETQEILEEARRAGAVAVEMESATLFALQWLRGFKAAAVFLVVNDAIDKSSVGLSEEEAKEAYSLILSSILDAVLDQSDA